MVKRKIGIVEDEPLSATFIKCVLEEMGHKVLFAVSSAAEAIENMENETAELVFLDINILGPKDGIALALELRQKYNELKIIFITAYTDSQTLQEASVALPSFFLPKPFDEKNIEIAVTMSVANIKEQETKRAKIIYSVSAIEGVLMKNGEHLHISPLERRIASKLLCSKGSLVSYDELISVVSRHGEHISQGSLRNVIMRLRKKLPELEIETVKDLGYCLSCRDEVVILTC